MSPRGIRRTALAAAALTSAAFTSVPASPVALAVAAPVAHAIGHTSPADPVSIGAPTMTMPALTASTYKYASILDGVPVRWNPCQVIHWRSNTAGGPVGGLTVLKEAVVHIAQLTGTVWMYDGATSTVPTTGYLPTVPTTTNKPIVIGWTDGYHSDLLAGKPAQVLGMTRTTWFGVDDGAGHRVAATRGAVIALDRTNRLPLRGAQSWKATALHELGHVMGLDHPASSSQLMAATLPNVTDLQYGDRTGLTRLGKAAGCVVIPGT